MRLLSHRIGWTVFGVAVGVGFEAQAQSLLQNLFGFTAGPQKPAIYRNAPRISAPMATWESRPRYKYPSSQISPARYRTMCVRTCDGYYFPISSSTMRGAFHRDAAKCKSSCGDEARLFYMPASNPDPERMVDLTGRSYAALPTAYVYRKRLIDGCACRPMPWSSSERLRHLRYAYAAEMAKIQEMRPLTLTAAPMSSSTSADEIIEEPPTPVSDGQLADSKAETELPQIETITGDSRISRNQPKYTRARRSSQGPKRQRPPAASDYLAGWGTSNASTYTWPGDAPRRHR